MVDVSDESIELPPGFRFHPTDEEIITHYLSPKYVNSSFSARAIGEVDLNKCEPWDLPKRARMGEKEWYFFCQRDRKYPTGMRTNRATEAGYWKATGKDKEIYKGGRNSLVGMKKTLVFYRGRAPKGEKTNWVMHEYRLDGKFSYQTQPKPTKDEWVVCRVFHKTTGVKKSPLIPSSGVFGDDLFDYSSLPPLMDTSLPTSSTKNGIYFNSTTLDGDNDNKSYINAAGFYPQTPFQNPMFGFQATPNLGYDQQAIYRALAANNTYDSKRQQCKVEQYSSNQSMVMSHSQDTGLSTDVNPEISSVAPRNNQMGGGGGGRVYEDYEGQITDYDSLWNL